MWFVGLKSKSADKVARGVLEYVRMFGPPKRILSDQGREFCNQTNEHLFSKFKIRHSMKSAYHPQTNGLDERTNQTLKVSKPFLTNTSKFSPTALLKCFDDFCLSFLNFDI